MKLFKIALVVAAVVGLSACGIDFSNCNIICAA